MAGFDNDVVYGTNVNFSTANATGGAATILTNGQMLIGTTALNAGGTHINVGTLSSPDSSVTIGYSTPNITLQVAGGSTTVQTLTGDVGGAIPPTAGNINVIGYKTSINTQLVDTHKTAVSTMSVENRTWITQFVVDGNAAVGDRGTFSTIQAAVTAAAGVTNGIIYIRPGTYTENITLTDGITLIGSTTNTVSFGVSGAPVKIKGKITYSGGARVNFLNVWLETNGDYAISTTGGFFDFTNCSFFGTDHTVFFGNGGGDFQIFNCSGTVAAGFAFFDVTAGTARVFGGNWQKSGTTNSTFAGANGGFEIHNAQSQEFFTFTGTTAFTATNCYLGNGSANTIITYGGSLGAEIVNCTIVSGNAAAISIGGSAKLCNTTIVSTNATAAISGAGTLIYSGLVFEGTGNIITTTTQTPRVSANDAKQVTTPGAYPYTTVPQDYLIKVDTSSARTITPYASPVTGQIHVIKDTVGSAAANNITITPSGKNVDGAASFVINVNYGSITIVYTGTEWSIV